MARAEAAKHWTLRASANKARKGRAASKRQIGRGYHHGKPDVEERSIERTLRQDAKKEILKAKDEG